VQIIEDMLYWKGSKNAPFWHGLKTPNFPLPKTPFKTEWVVEGLWHFDG